MFKRPTMLVKIRCGPDNLTICVPDDIGYAGFYSKVLKKIRNCRGAAALGMDGQGAGLQIKWLDADHDEVTLRCDADLEAMWEECKEMKTNEANIVAR
jgi:cell division control protein 24